MHSLSVRSLCRAGSSSRFYSATRSLLGSGGGRGEAPRGNASSFPKVRNATLRSGIAARTAALAEHEEAAKAFGTPWVIETAVNVERIPVIQADPLPHEITYHQLQLERAEFGRGEDDGGEHPMAGVLKDFEKPPLTVGFMDTPGLSLEDDVSEPIDPDAVAEEDGGEVRVPHWADGAAPRVTEADATGDRKTMNRRLQDSLFLLAKAKGGAAGGAGDAGWDLLKSPLGEDETLRDGAERTARAALGENVDLMFLGNAPMGFWCRPYPADVQKEVNAYGEKVFFYRCQVRWGGWGGGWRGYGTQGRRRDAVV